VRLHRGGRSANHRATATLTSVADAAGKDGFTLCANRAEASNSKAAATGMSRFDTKRARSTAKAVSWEGLNLAHSKRRARR